MQPSPNAKMFLGALLVVFGLVVLVDFSLAKAVIYLFAVLLVLLVAA